MVAKGHLLKKIAPGGARQPWWREDPVRSPFAPAARSGIPVFMPQARTSIADEGGRVEAPDLQSLAFAELL